MPLLTTSDLRDAQDPELEDMVDDLADALAAALDPDTRDLTAANLHFVKLTLAEQRVTAAGDDYDRAFYVHDSAISDEDVLRATLDLAEKGRLVEQRISEHRELSREDDRDERQVDRMLTEDELRDLADDELAIEVTDRLERARNASLNYDDSNASFSRSVTDTPERTDVHEMIAEESDDLYTTMSDAKHYHRVAKAIQTEREGNTMTENTETRHDDDLRSMGAATSDTPPSNLEEDVEAAGDPYAHPIDELHALSSASLRERYSLAKLNFADATVRMESLVTRIAQAEGAVSDEDAEQLGSSLTMASKDAARYHGERIDIFGVLARRTVTESIRAMEIDEEIECLDEAAKALDGTDSVAIHDAINERVEMLTSERGDLDLTTV
jgi:hypothetical protein